MNAELLYMQNIDTNAHVDGGYILRSADKGNEVIPLLESEESMFNPSLSFAHESQEWYEYIRAYLLQMFQRIFFRSASRAGNFLGKNSLMIFLNSSVDKWIRYLVLPIPSLLMNSFCFIACLCFLIAMVSNTLYMMYYLTELGTMRHKHYRLSIEESKYGNPGVTDGMEFGLVANSCTLSLEGASRKSVGSSIYLSYPEPVEANGFYIIHNGSYPTKFLLEASEDLQTWSVHGASSKHFRCTGFFVIDWVYRPDIAYDFSKPNPEFIPNLCLQFGQEGLNSNCNNLIFVSNAWRWPMIFPIYMNMVIIAGLMVWIYASVKTEYAKNMKFPLLLLVLLSAGGCLIFAIIWCILPDMSGITQPENSMYAWNLFVLYLCFAWAVMKLYERYFLSVCIVFEFLFLISNYVNLWYAYGNSAPVSEYWLASVYFLLIIAFAAGVHAGSAWSLHVANKRFEGYRDRIRRMVLDTLDDGGASSLLESMDTKVESLRDRRRSSGAILQDSPSAVDLGSMRFDLAATLSEFGSDAAMLQDSRDSCVQCLDQLFIQAEMLKPFLNMKVVEHAIRSEGLLLSTRNEWLTADQLKSDPETCRRVKWTSIKSMSRIVSKSFCSYEGETCLLTDVCRERIVFEDMRAMNKCLYSILEDPQMLVFRAKNSMKDCLTSNEEYHIGVILTVRLIMPQTHSLGISRHVCELQLMLRKFADLQDQSSHQEYVAYRNALVSEKLRISYNLRRTLHLLCRLWRPAHRPPRVSADNEALHDEAPEQLLMQEDSWVEKFCRSRACNAGDVVSSQLSVIHEAIAKASYSSCFFTSTPIAAALCKPVFQLLFVVIGVVYFAQLGWIIYGYMSNAYFQYQDFLFSVKKFDGIPLDQGNFTLASFGLLKRGCRVASAARIVQTSQASALISMKTSMLADGWYYELPPDTDPSAIPVAFTLDGSKDGKKWKLAGASVFVTGEAGWVVLSSRSNDNLRNKLGYQYEYIPSSVWLVSWIFTFFIGGALYWFAAFVSVLHQSVYVKHIGGLGYLFEVLFTLLPIPWLVVEGNWIAAIDFLLRGTCWALLGYFVRFAEQYWVIASAFVGIYFMAIELIIIFFLHADARYFWFQFLSSSFIHFGSVMFFFGVLSIAVRLRFLLIAEALIKQDRDSYMEIWERLQEDESNIVHMENLQAMADAIAPQGRIRQRIPVDIEQAWKEVGFAVPCTMNRFLSRVHSLLRPSKPVQEPVQCLDQLLAQAEGLDAPMRFLCQRWAAACNGFFPMQGKTFMKWTEVLERRMTESVLWAKTKRPLRIIEKTLRSYGHDPSYLCDICRQCIVFESLQDLVRCVQHVISDQDVVVERIKNRFVALKRGTKHSLQKESYNSLHSTGYRDVMVNIRIVTDRTKELGISWHICELQLLLLDYARIKSELGHSRYIQWRNTRGE